MKNFDSTIVVPTNFVFRYLNQAMKNFDSTIVVPTNFVFFTISAIVAGKIYNRESPKQFEN